MKIKPYSTEYFRFTLDPEEKETSAGKKFVTDLKEAIPHGDRFWIREDRAWAIRVSRLDDFLELMVKFAVNTVNTGQGVLF